MLKNIACADYDSYLDEAEERTDHRFTFDGLREYTDNILLGYERELEAIEKYIDDKINTKSALKKLKKHFETDATPSQVNNTLLQGNIHVDSNLMKDLFNIYVLAHKMNKRKIAVKRRITDLNSILKRIKKLKNIHE